jgi:hypothetical protein
MSIINSDGLNANWQLNVLKGLSSINDNAQNVINIGSQLNSILVAIQAGTDYESAIVLDAAGVTWLEIRIYDSATSTFNPPVYYLAGTNTPGTPLAPLTYVNPNTYLAQIVTNTTAVSRTPVYFRTTTSGTIAAVTYSFSIANVGSANGTFLGDPIKPGESVNFGADGINNSYAASTFTFDGTGTELLITYNS